MSKGITITIRLAGKSALMLYDNVIKRGWTTGCPLKYSQVDQHGQRLVFDIFFWRQCVRFEIFVVQFPTISDQLSLEVDQASILDHIDIGCK